MNKKLISYYFNLLKVSSNRLKFNLKNFGIKVAVVNFLGEMSDYKKFQKYKFSIYLRKKQREVVYKALEKRYSDLIEEYKNKEIAVGENSKKIWFFRWEGIREENIVVRKSLESVKKHCGDYEVNVITHENYQDYVKLPEKIIEKVNNGTITLTKLSEIVRARLLSLYGGVWTDSTILYFDNIFNEFDDVVFNSPNKWFTFLIGGKPNKLFSFLYDFYTQYHLEYDEVIDYFIVDHGFLIAYNNFDECKKYIDDGTLQNLEVFYLLKNFSNTYNKEEFDKVCKKYRFFKISDKPSVNAKEYDKNGNLTNYGYFKYKLKF